MDTEQLQCLPIQPDVKRRLQHALWTIFAPIGIVAVAAEYEWTLARFAERGLVNR